MSLEYYSSERFIHDDLVIKAQKTIDLFYELWKESGRIDPILLTWPAEVIKDDNGEPIEGCCGLQLPEKKTERLTYIKKWVERTKAYALFVAENEGDRIKAILETPNGTRTWTIPIKKSGVDFVLGEAIVKDNTECVGLIWRPSKGSA